MALTVRIITVKKNCAGYLVYAHFMLAVLFDHKHRGDMFLLNVR
jgi:hypothetical protein